MKTKRPATEVRPIATRLMEELLRARVVERVEAAGSLRRGVDQVGDIELVAIPVFDEKDVPDTQKDLFAEPTVKTIRHNKLWEYLDIKAERTQLEYSKRGEKYRQFQLGGVQVDLFTAERETWGWIHLIRTGSAEFSRAVAIALNGKGYTSEGGWIKKEGSEGRRLETPTEHHVFRLASMRWTDPKDRSW